MPVNFRMPLVSRFFLIPAISVSLAATTGTILPGAAKAASTANWQCVPMLDSPLPVPLSTRSSEEQRTDRRMITLQCAYNANASGMSEVTLCVAAPLGRHPQGLIRRAKHQAADNYVEYLLNAEMGMVPGGRPRPMNMLATGLTPVYTVSLNNAEAGMQQFRQQFFLVTQFQALKQRGISAGDYQDTLEKFVVSIHDGSDCGELLWGPPKDMIGALEMLSVAAKIDPECAVQVRQAVDFGSIATEIAGQTASGAVQLNCFTSQSAASISMGTGNNPGMGNNGMTRRMRLEGPQGAPETSASFVPYVLLKPDGSEWSETGSSIPGSALVIEGKDQTVVPVLARIPAGTPRPAPGDYSDSVIVTLGF